jgi:hypothetical protein
MFAPCFDVSQHPSNGTDAGCWVLFEPVEHLQSFFGTGRFSLTQLLAQILQTFLHINDVTPTISNPTERLFSVYPFCLVFNLNWYEVTQ